MFKFSEALGNSITAVGRVTIDATKTVLDRAEQFVKATMSEEPCEEAPQKSQQLSTFAEWIETEHAAIRSLKKDYSDLQETISLLAHAGQDVSELTSAADKCALAIQDRTSKYEVAYFAHQQELKEAETRQAADDAKELLQRLQKQLSE